MKVVLKDTIRIISLAGNAILKTRVVYIKKIVTTDVEDVK